MPWRATQELTGSCYFETFGDGLFGFLHEKLGKDEESIDFPTSCKGEKQEICILFTLITRKADPALKSRCSLSSFALISAQQTVSPHRQQSRIVGSVQGRVRKLSGYQKSHHIPDGHHAAAQAFVRKVGQQNVKDALDQLYADIRSLFEYKRKEFAYTCEDGFGVIKTPDFDLQIRIDQCTEDAKTYALTTEIVALHTETIAQDERFHACFTHHCEQLVVEVPGSINLDDKIDAIEAIPEIADCLDYEPDGSSFELKLPKLDLQILVTDCEITFQLLTSRNLRKLLDHSQKAFDILAEADLGLKLG